MDRELSRRALQLFEQTMDLPETQRAVAIEEACDGNLPLKKKLESLFASQEAATDLLPCTDDDTSEESRPAAETPPTSHSPRFSAGTRLADRYQIVATLGSGGMGTVYRARDDHLDREVAIKTLNHASLQHKQMHQRFEREIRSVAALSHPGIVTLYDVATHDGLKFAVMEIIDGQTLRELIPQRPDWTTAAQLTRDVALGLAAAHDRDMMHRDIKPENIIVTTEWRARILDFGLARPEVSPLDQNITTTEMVAGTVPYMSPEQVESRTLTCATDIFSLGTVLYELLTGQHPFRGAGMMQTMRQVSEASPEPVRSVNGDVPQTLAELLDCMLAPQPEQRPASRELADQLTALLNGSGSTPPPAGTASRPPSARFSDQQPSLIVLPFQTFGADENLSATADGLVENLTTILTRVPMLALTSRVSSFSMKGQSATADEIRRRFGVDYMIEGSLQKLGDRIRANVQLIDTRNSFHLWAQQFDVPSDDSVLVALLHSILPRLEPQLVRAIFNDVRGEAEELSSRQLLLQAMSVLTLRGWHGDSFREVAELLRRSLELESDYALTHAYLALIRGLGKRVGLVSDPAVAARDAVRHADLALDLEDMDSNVLGLAGCALADVGETDRAIPILRNAIEFNPNNAQAHAALGGAFLAIEDFAEAAEHLQRGIDISPLDPRLAVWYSMLAVALLQMDEPDRACDAARRGCQSDRRTYMPRVVLSAVHLIRGEPDQAAVAMNEGRRVKPDLSQVEITCLIGSELGSAVGRLPVSDSRP